MLRMAVLVEHMHLQLAEAATERDLLRFIEALRGERQQHVAMERGAHRGEGGIGQRA